MPVRLTETAIKAALAKAAATGQRRDLADAGQEGLRLRVTPGGASSWVLACRDAHGRMRRFPIGSWPAVGLADAREKARALRPEVRKGADPVAEARRMRAIGKDAQAGVGTLAALLDLYGGPLPRKGEEESAPKVKPIGPGKDLKSWPENRRRIEHVFAAHLKKPTATMALADLQMTADTHPSRSSAAAAVRYLRPILKWATKRQYVPRETTLIEPPEAPKQRDRVLSPAELAAILPALKDSADAYRRCMRFMLLTLCRRDEAADARWRDIDLSAAEWRIPDTKSGREHVVPLSRQALDLLEAIGPGAAGALIFANTADGALSNWDRETKRLMVATKTSGWHRHDLRRTGATLLGDLGVDPHVVEAALNHVAIHSALAATYNRARYLPQVRDALQMLADRLDGIAAGGAEVRNLAAERGKRVKAAD